MVCGRCQKVEEEEEEEKRDTFDDYANLRLDVCRMEGRMEDNGK